MLGEDPARAGPAWRARIGVVLQESEPPGLLSVREVLDLFAGYFPHPRPVEDTIAQAGLEAQAEMRAQKLSGGQRRRLEVAMALIGDPELLFLDEPTTGFDPAARREAWEVIEGLRAGGKTIFLTTHYLDEAQRLADRVAIVKDGAIVAEGPPAELAGRDRARAVIAFSLPDGAGELPGGLSAAPAAGPGGRLELRTERVVDDLARAVRLGARPRHRPARTGGHPPEPRGRLPRAGAMSLVLHQYRYDQRQFWREPASVFFTAVLPLIFLVLFVAIFGNEDTDVGDHTVKGATYYLPAILALALLNATFVNLTIWVTIERERGHLKRVRATPVPAWVVIAGRALTAAAVAAVMVVVVCTAGLVLYGVDLPGETLPGAVLAIVVGVLALTALGFAASALVPSENAAPPIANVIVLPLEFMSGIFVPQSEIPDWMDSVAGVFPVKPLFDALLLAFDPTTEGAGIAWGDLAVLAAWGAAGAIAAVRLFRWSPRR